MPFLQRYEKLILFFWLHLLYSLYIQPCAVFNIEHGIDKVHFIKMV
jgi:hypothetical protein